MCSLLLCNKKIGYHARLKEDEHLFRYCAQLEGNFFYCVGAGAHSPALMTRKLSAVWMAQCNTEESPYKRKASKNA